MARRPTETEDRERFEDLFENGGPLERRRYRDVGGTSGGIGSFFLGAVLVIASLYVLSTRITVTTGFMSFYGYSSFGPTLLILLIGIGMLFFNAKSILGWLFSVGGVAFILLNIVLNLNVYFPSTSLLSAIFMFGSLAAGLGLIGKSLRSTKG